MVKRLLSSTCPQDEGEGEKMGSGQGLELVGNGDEKCDFIAMEQS